MTTPAEHAATVPSYWDYIEAALTALPEDAPLRKDALAAFDHLKERVLANHVALAERATELERAVEWRELIAEDWKRRATELERTVAEWEASFADDPLIRRAVAAEARAEQLETALRLALTWLEAEGLGESIIAVRARAALDGGTATPEEKP